MICPGAVLQSPSVDRIVVVLAVNISSMGPDKATILQAWSASCACEEVPITDLCESIEKGALVHASGPILALGLACFKKHTELNAAKGR